MAIRARHRNGNLEAAMTMLLQSQVALARQHVEFLDRSEKRNAEMEKRQAEMEKKHAEIMRELDVIKTVLARHERILERLPEVIRQKIGFKGE